MVYKTMHPVPLSLCDLILFQDSDKSGIPSHVSIEIELSGLLH